MAAPNKPARNEQVKLMATALNNLGIAFVVSGIIVPIVALAYQSSLPRTNYWAAFALVWLAFGVGFHLSGRAALRRIEE